MGLQNWRHANTYTDRMQKKKFSTVEVSVTGSQKKLLIHVSYSNETYFILSVYVNSHNSDTWSVENPHVVYGVFLRDLTIGVSCAISLHRIVPPMIFKNTMNSKCYVLFSKATSLLDDLSEK